MRSKNDLFSIFQMNCSSSSFVWTTSLFLTDLCFTLYLNYFSELTVDFWQGFWCRCERRIRSFETFLVSAQVWMLYNRGEKETPERWYNGANWFILIYSLQLRTQGLNHKPSDWCPWYKTWSVLLHLGASFHTFCWPLQRFRLPFL